jgi:hypothetical protein
MTGQQWRQRTMRHAAAGLGVALVAVGAPLAAAPTASAQHPCLVKPLTNGVHSGFDCQGQYLRNHNLNGMQLNGGYFVNANFSGMHLKGVNFTGATLNDANFQGTTFDNVTLVDAELIGAKLEGAKINKTSNITRANVTKTVMMPARAGWHVWPVTQKMLKEEAHPITGTYLYRCLENSLYLTGEDGKGFPRRPTGRATTYSITCHFGVEGVEGAPGIAAYDHMARGGMRIFDPAEAAAKAMEPAPKAGLGDGEK